MKILITGVNGLLGQKVFQKLHTDNELYICDLQEAFFIPGAGKNYHQVDITRYESLKKVMDFSPDYIINCAAYTHVDGCETEKELSWKVNVKAVEYLAYFSRRFNAHLIHISSDYIFNGKKGLYTESDKPEPLSQYGKEKLASENAILQQASRYTILRTNVLFGAAYGGSANFVTWLIQKLSTDQPVSIVTDQYNNANWVEDLAWGIDKVIKNNCEGVFHFGGREYLNRYEMGKIVAAVLNKPLSLIHPISTKDLKQAAVRPMKGGLNTQKATDLLNYQPTAFNRAAERVIKQMKRMEQL